MLVRMAGRRPYVVATQWSDNHRAALAWSAQTIYFLLLGLLNPMWVLQ